MRVITFKIDESLLEEIDRLATRKGLTRSDVIRKALLELLRREGNTIIKPRITIRRVVIA